MIGSCFVILSTTYYQIHLRVYQPYLSINILLSGGKLNHKTDTKIMLIMVILTSNSAAFSVV